MTLISLVKPRALRFLSYLDTGDEVYFKKGDSYLRLKPRNGVVFFSLEFEAVEVLKNYTWRLLLKTREYGDLYYTVMINIIEEYNYLDLSENLSRASEHLIKGTYLGKAIENLGITEKELLEVKRKGIAVSYTPRIEMEKLLSVIGEKSLIIISGPRLIGKSVFLASILSNRDDDRVLTMQLQGKEGAFENILLKSATYILGEEIGNLRVLKSKIPNPEIWIDLDHYFGSERNGFKVTFKKFLSDLFLFKDFFSRIVLVMDSSMLDFYLNQIRNKESINNVQFIVIHPIEEGLVRNTITNIMLNEMNINQKKAEQIADQILKRENERFRKPPYLLALRNIASEFTGSESYLVSRILIASYRELNHRLNKHLHENAYQLSYEELLGVDSFDAIKNSEPTSYVNYGVSAIDIEEGNVACQEEINRIINSLDPSDKNVVLIIGGLWFRKNNVRKKYCV